MFEHDPEHGGQVVDVVCTPHFQVADGELWSRRRSGHRDGHTDSPARAPGFPSLRL
jgi:hypothetical protein